MRGFLIEEHMGNKFREVREPLILKDLEKNKDVGKGENTGRGMLTNFLPAPCHKIQPISSFGNTYCSGLHCKTTIVNCIGQWKL